MNAVDVEERVESIEHLDFELTCEVRVSAVIQLFGVILAVGATSKPCGEAAVGYLHCRGCGHSALTCEKHREVCVGIGHVMCSICHKGGPASEVYLFEPLQVCS